MGNSAAERFKVAGSGLPNLFNRPRSTSFSAELAEFYVRYCVGHKGNVGQDFLEFEFRPDRRLRYANKSSYKNDIMIRKECYVNPAVLSELEKFIHDFEILKEDDNHWPAPDRVGRQELELLMGKDHI